MKLLTNLSVVGIIAVGLALSASGADQDDKIFVAADFNSDIQNALGGFHNRFQNGQSTAATFMTAEVRRGEAGRSLRITADRDRDGFCGAWMHFFDFRAETPTYFDATAYQYLTFWVKGETGGERFTIQFADRRWIEKEDSVRIASVNAMLKGHVTTAWKQVVIPLRGIDEVNLRQLGGITFLFDVPGHHTVYIDDIAFKTSKELQTPITQAGDVPAIDTTSKPKAMWIWHTDELLYSKDGRSQRELFEFCKQQGVGTVWLQLLYSFEPRVDLGPPSAQTAIDAERVRCELKDPGLFRAFLRNAHAAGIKVFALDGYPEYGQKEYHHLPLAIVDAIIQFNKEGPEKERFDGIHFDNEPHLLIGWSDWRRRERILGEFLAVNAECQRRVRTQSSMEFGVDIPFWWQNTEEDSGRPIGLVEFNGVRKPASYHCIDILDSVGIMNYRDTADGADGMIVHGRELLIYGDIAKHAKIHMGVETFKYSPMEIWLAVGIPKRQFGLALDEAGHDYSFLSRIEGFKIHTFDDGANIHVGVEIPPDLSREREDTLQRVVGEVAKRYGVSLNTKLKKKISHFRNATVEALKSDPAWTNPRLRSIPVPGVKGLRPGIQVTRLMQSKITFGDDSLEQMRLQMEATEQFFVAHPSFSGFAVHYYKTFRELVDRDAAERNKPKIVLPEGTMGD